MATRGILPPLCPDYSDKSG
ncbi:hypothetical protein QQF64_007733, partial [Cirrhinus molitorella]